MTSWAHEYCVKDCAKTVFEKCLDEMSGVFDVFFVWILTLFLQIQGGGGLCSPAKEAECGLLWRTCLNELCGECVVEIGGECYNPNSAEDVLLERLENCDPSVNAECKRSLEDVSEQLLVQLGDDRIAESTTLKPGVRDVQSNTNVALQGKLSEKLSQNEDDGDKTLSKEGKARESARSSSSKKDPVKDSDDNDDIPDVYFLIIIIACTLSGMAGIALSGYCWYKLHYSDNKLKKSDYIPAVKRESSKSAQSKNGDRSMDYNAEMYHYVHTKNKIAAMERAKSDHLSSSMSNDEDDDDEVEDYTVYECPGLAPTGDMTVVNPLFSDQEVSVSDEGRGQSTHNSPTPPSGVNHSPVK